MIEVLDIKDAEPNKSNWIPCSVKMPGENTIVLASFMGWRVVVLEYCGKGVFRGHNESYTTREIDAWMPFPEPYRGENNE